CRALHEGLADLVAAALRRARDAVERRQSFSQLRGVLARAERLRALGQVAVGVAHDLKNFLSPLTMGLGYVQRTLRRGDLRGPDLVRLLEQLEQLLHHGSSTIDRVHRFGRQAAESPRELASLDPLLREALALCRPLLQAHPGARFVLREEL